MEPSKLGRHLRLAGLPHLRTVLNRATSCAALHSITPRHQYGTHLRASPAPGTGTEDASARRRVGTAPLYYVEIAPAHLTKTFLFIMVHSSDFENEEIRLSCPRFRLVRCRGARTHNRRRQAGAPRVRPCLNRSSPTNRKWVSTNRWQRCPQPRSCVERPASGQSIWQKTSPPTIRTASLAAVESPWRSHESAICHEPMPARPGPARQISSSPRLGPVAAVSTNCCCSRGLMLAGHRFGMVATRQSNI